MSESAGGRIITLDIAGGRSSCMREHLYRQIDEVINAGAIQEAAAATSDLVSPDELHDTGESPYLIGEVGFEELEARCDDCFTHVTVDRNGNVIAEACIVSGVCEWQIADRFSREGYTLAAGSPSEQPVRCAGIDCRAKVALLGTPLAPKIVSGECTVDRRAGEWRDRMAADIKNAPRQAPSPEHVERFDGIDIGDYPDEV